jgi:hypothetical protein
MSQGQIHEDIEKLRTTFVDEPVPLDVLMKEFSGFKPNPVGRGRELTEEQKAASIARLVRALYAKVEEAIEKGDLSVANELPGPLTLLGSDGVINALGGKTSAEARGRYFNYRIRLDDKFVSFVGGDEKALGKLGAAYGPERVRKTAQAKAARTFPALVHEAVTKHLRGSKVKAVVEFLEEYDKLKEARRTGGRPRRK